MTKVLLTKPYFSGDIDFIKLRLVDGIELVDPKLYDEDNLIMHSSNCDAFLGAYVSENLIDHSPNLKLIQIPWTGVDKFNFTPMKKSSAVVCNSHSNSIVVAEHALALFFALTKKICVHDRLMRKGDWNRPKQGAKGVISPFSKAINSLTIGILGFGAIGENIYKMLSPFGASFSIHTSSPKNLNLNVKHSHGSENLNNFLSNIDILFIAIPLTNETNKILSKKQFDVMKNTSQIINISRGEVIDEDDLFEALTNNCIGGAALDTWWLSPSNNVPSYPSNREFHKFENIIMSSHRAGMVDGGFPHLLDAIDNLNNLHLKKKLKNIVELNKRY